MRSWLASLALLVLACGEPAGSIVIVIDTDLAMPAELDAVVLRRFDASGALVDERAVAVRSPVELAPVARADEPLHVVALGRVAGRPIVDTEARTRFVPGARLRLDLFLARECVDARCPSTLTCGAGGCRDVFVDPEALPPWQDLDAGRARDATITRDATRPRDATLDARTPPPTRELPMRPARTGAPARTRLCSSTRATPRSSTSTPAPRSTAATTRMPAGGHLLRRTARRRSLPLSVGDGLDRRRLRGPSLHRRSTVQRAVERSGPPA
ncbi:MAG: hypothetical protein M5U28_41655 [Sandaracinaceae bacterium]|nr:hypothetical protein [Sandaracinaceae bacterium]